MTTRHQQAGSASDANATRRQWLQARSLPLIAAALVSVSGCLPTGESPEISEELADETSETRSSASADAESSASDAEAMREALRTGAWATPEDVGGFCVDGVGVLLTAVDDAAELTVYVVAPAKSATFTGAALRLTIREGDHSMTEVAELEDVTLEAGESHVFRREAHGQLMDAFANFAGE